MHVLKEVLKLKGITVNGIFFDGDALAVKLFCTRFVERTQHEYGSVKNKFNYKDYCDQHWSLFPFCDPARLLKRIGTYLLNHNSVLDHSVINIDKIYVIGVKLYKYVTGMTTKRLLIIDLDLSWMIVLSLNYLIPGMSRTFCLYDCTLVFI